MLLAGAVVRNRVWKDDRSLWSDVIQKAPHKALGYLQLGQSDASENPTLARQLYETGFQIEADNADGHTNLGLILLSQGDPENALGHLHKALTLGGEKSLVSTISAQPSYGASKSRTALTRSEGRSTMIRAGSMRGGI
jgi:hypothetical protein